MQVSQPNEQLETRDNEISIYRPGKVSAESFAHGSKKIQDAFPKLHSGWFKILDQMLDEEKFSEEKFRDAVNCLIKYCVYPEPTIANILSFDKTIKVFTYQELQFRHRESYFMGATYDPIASEYSKIDYYGQIRYAKKEDVKKFGIEVVK